MPDDAINEVVVVVPDDASTPVTNPADTANPSGSETVTGEIIDVILDPLGSGSNSADSAATTAGVVEEFVVVEPGMDSSATGGAVSATDPMDGITTPTGDAEPVGMSDPIGASPDIEGGSTMPDTTGLSDSAVADAGLGDATSGVVGSDPGVTPADTDSAASSSTDTTDPDALNDAQQTLQQHEQTEGQAAASGDYAAASDDAQQAYSASQDVANAGGPDNTDETWQASQDESWANWDQQTANEDAQTAQSYADDTSGNPDDAADAQLYGDAAQDQQENADASGEAGEYGDSLGPQDDSSAVADDTPVDDSAAADTSSVDDDSSAT